MKLTAYFLRHPVTANLIMVMIFLVGGLTLFQLKRATYPTVHFDILKITTTYRGASARDVEVNVTEKIEEELDTVDGIEKTKSISLENISLVYVFVDTDTDDIKQAKDDIRRAVDRVTDFPPEVTEKPDVEELRSANVPVLEVAISGEASEMILRKIARDLEDAIQAIPGVMSVEKVGYRKREIKILVDMNKLAEQYVSFNEVIAAIRHRNVRATGGNLESFMAEKRIVTFSEFEDPLEVMNVIVRSNFEGSNILLSDIATVENTFEDYQVKPRTNGQTSINLMIRSHGGGDIIDISEAVQEAIREFNKHLPQAVSISIVQDYSTYTDIVLGIVKSNAFIGFFLVLIVLLLFLDRYSALWIATGIPISILGAIALFPLFDIDINFISLITMIIVIGIVVDDAIVIGENISRYRQEGLPAREAALKGVRELVWPVMTTIASTILAFIPMFFMTGITGKFVRQIQIIVIIALIRSLLEAITLLPSHIAHSPHRAPGAHGMTLRMRTLYQRVLHFILSHRRKTLASLIVIPVAALMVYIGTMKFILFPFTDIDMFHVIAELHEGTSIEGTTERIKEVEQIVAQISSTEMVNFVTRVGHHDMDVYGSSAGLRENWALITVFLKHAGERDRTSETIMKELGSKLEVVQGFDKLYLEKYYDGPPVGKPITLTYASDNQELLLKFARKTYDELKSMPGVQALDMDFKPGKEELRLKLNHTEMAGLGISVSAVADTIRAAYDGVVASDLVREGEEIDFRVQLRPEQRQSIDILLKLQIPNQTGRLIRLESFASLVPTPGIESIKHYDGRRSITITGDVDTKRITAVEVNQQIRDQFEQEAQQQPGLRMIFGGEEQATQESMQSFFWAFLCAMIGIYFLLIILLESFFQPLMIMAAIPIGLAGVVFGFFVHRLPLSFLALIGSLGLIGVIVNDSLVMVTHLNTRRKERRITLQELIAGCTTRLRPVVLTTITTVAGLIPTIYGLGGYEPFIVPIVLSLASGLIIATLGTLLLIPVLYSLCYQISDS